MSARGRKLTAFPSRDGELAETKIGLSETGSGRFRDPVQVVLLEYVVDEIGQRQICRFSSSVSVLLGGKAFHRSELDRRTLFWHLLEQAILSRRPLTEPPIRAGVGLPVIRSTFRPGQQSLG